MHVPIENIMSAGSAKEKIEGMIQNIGADDVYVFTHQDRPKAVLVSVDALKDMVEHHDMPALPKERSEAAKPSQDWPYTLAPKPPSFQDSKKEPFSPLTPPKPPIPPTSAFEAPKPPPPIPPLKPLSPPDLPKPPAIPPLPPLPPKPAGPTPSPDSIPRSPLGGVATGPLVTEREADQAVSAPLAPPRQGPLGGSSTPPPPPSGATTVLPPKVPEPPKVTSPFSNLASADMNASPKPSEGLKPDTAKDDDDADNEIL